VAYCGRHRFIGAGVDVRLRPMIARYTRTAVMLHWTIAIIVVGQFAWGWLMQEIPKSPPGSRADAFNFHKSIGLCILALMLFRLGWRSANPPPTLPALPAWQASLAKSTHVALYAALIVMPLAGYLGSVWSGYPIKWFGVTLPAWGTRMPALKDAMSVVHLATSWLLLALVALHVTGAVRHAVRGEGIAMRMTLARRTFSSLRQRRADRRLNVAPASDHKHERSRPCLTMNRYFRRPRGNWPTSEIVWPPGRPKPSGPSVEAYSPKGRFP
jgi:cytochrome b561